MKKFTGVRSKLISGIEKYQFIENMIRGGIFMISKGCAGANNKFLKLYDPNKPTSYITYLDANNLYGHSMMYFLSFEIHDWVNSEKIILDNYQDNFDYPDDLHDLQMINYLVATEKNKSNKRNTV